MDTLKQFFVILLHTCADINHQEWIKIEYQSIIQTRDSWRYMYKLLDLPAQLNPQPPKFEVKKKIKWGLKDHVLDELVKILDIPTDLGNFINQVKHIDRNLYKYSCTRQQQTNRYNWIIMTICGQHSLPRSETLRFSSITLSTNLPSRSRPTKGILEWSTWCQENCTCYNYNNKDHKSWNCLQSLSKSKGQQR